jgi:predicted transcriptional regulator
MDKTAKNFTTLIKKLELTGHGFSCLVGISTTTVTLYMQGKRKPSLKTVRKILNKLKENGMIDKLKTQGIDVNMSYLRPDWSI